MTGLVIGGALLLCLGLLLGSAWTTQACQPKFRRYAEDRRRLNEEWQSLRLARQRAGRCPQCEGPLAARTADYALD